MVQSTRFSSLFLFLLFISSLIFFNNDFFAMMTRCLFLGVCWCCFRSNADYPQQSQISEASASAVSFPSGTWHASPSSCRKRFAQQIEEIFSALGFHQVWPAMMLLLSCSSCSENQKTGRINIPCLLPRVKWQTRLTILGLSLLADLLLVVVTTQWLLLHFALNILPCMCRLPFIMLGWMVVSWTRHLAKEEINPTHYANSPWIVSLLVVFHLGRFLVELLLRITSWLIFVRLIIFGSLAELVQR